MKQLGLVVLVMLVSMFTNSAHAFKNTLANEAAQEYASGALPDAGTVWHCWYDGITLILCQLGSAREPSRSAPSGVVNTIWKQAAELDGELIAIPLHVPPTQPERKQ